MKWFAKPDFWTLFYERMFPTESFEQGIDQVDNIVELSGIHSGTVLDLCCGPGRHSIPLAQRGFQVTAVDLQENLLDKAKQYASKTHTHVDFIQGDMRTYKKAKSFDLAINMFSSFGYFEVPGDDFIVLENVFASLKSGGVLVLDVRGKEIHAMNFRDSLSQTMPNGDLIFETIKVNDDWTRSEGTWVYVKGERAHRFDIIFNLYSGAELRLLLEQAGFHQIMLYGDLAGSPYNHNAKRLIAVAKKP